MKAITLYQPWATWIALGRKTIETRGHAGFRSLVNQTIAIHAGRTFDEFALAEARRWMDPALWDTLVAYQAAWHGYPRGIIVCTALVTRFRVLDVFDNREALCDCSGGGRYGLFLSQITPCDGPKISGKMGIWELTQPIEPHVRPAPSAWQQEAHLF
jgi:hypothetical protein